MTSPSTYSVVYNDIKLSWWERFCYRYLRIPPKRFGKKIVTDEKEFKHLDEFYNHKTGKWYVSSPYLYYAWERKMTNG